MEMILWITMIKKISVQTNCDYNRETEYFNRSPDNYIEMRNVYGGSQSTGKSPEPAGNTTLFVFIGGIILIVRHFLLNVIISPLDFYAAGDRL